MQSRNRNRHNESKKIWRRERDRCFMFLFKWWRAKERTSQESLRDSQLKINECILLNSVNFGSDSCLLYWPLKVVKQRNDWERRWPCCTKEVNYPAAKATYISKGSNPTKRGCHGAVSLTRSSICSCIDFSHGRRCEWIYLENQTRGSVFYNCWPAGHFPEASNCSPRCNERATVFLNVAECSCWIKAVTLIRVSHFFSEIGLSA